MVQKTIIEELEEERRGTESMFLEVQCEVCEVSDDLGCLVLVHCVLSIPQSTGDSGALYASFC